MVSEMTYDPERALFVPGRRGFLYVGLGAAIASAFGFDVAPEAVIPARVSPFDWLVPYDPKTMGLSALKPDLITFATPVGSKLWVDGEGKPLRFVDAQWARGDHAAWEKKLATPFLPGTQAILRKSGRQGSCPAEMLEFAEGKRG